MEEQLKMNIWLADDDQDDRELLQEALKGLAYLDFSVTAFRDGRELLQGLSGNPEIPDLIFLDLNMPGINGFECLKNLRENAIFRKVQVAIYSTSSAEQDMSMAFEMGADVYMKKPDNFQRLQAMLDNLLRSGSKVPMKLV